MGYAVVEKIYGTDLIAGSAIRAPVIADVRQIRRPTSEMCAGSSTYCAAVVKSRSD